MTEALQSPFRVLFVDDDTAFLDTVKAAFGGFAGDDWRIATTSDPGAVAALLQREPVDLIVLDLHMPDISGLQMIGILNREYPGVAKVFLAGAAEEAERVQGLESGAQLFLEKPSDLEGLKSIFATLNELLKWRRKQGARGVPARAGILDLVKLECSSGNSRVFEISSAEASGQVYIKDGVIIHAECPGRRGQSAFSHLTTRLDAEFSLRQYSEPKERSIYRQWEFLYLEAVQLREQVAQVAAEAKAKQAAAEAAADAAAAAPQVPAMPAATEAPSAVPAPVESVPTDPASRVPHVSDEEATRQLFLRRKPAEPAPATAGAAAAPTVPAVPAPAASVESAAAPTEVVTPPPGVARRPAVPEPLPQLRMVGSAPVAPAAETPPAAAGLAPSGPTIEEMLVCTNQHEVLYEWQCADTNARMRFIEVARERSERISQHLPVGGLDRVELLAGVGRVVMQFQDDGSVFVRSASGGEPGVLGESIMHQSMAGWMARYNGTRGLLAGGIIRPGQAALSQSAAEAFPRETLSVAWRCVQDLFEAAEQAAFPAWQLRWLHEQAQLYVSRRADGKALALFLTRDPAQLDAEAIERMFGDFKVLVAV